MITCGYLKNSFEKAKILLTNEQTERLMEYYTLLVEKNKVMNLTAITEFEDVVKKHFLDSVLLAQVEETQRLLQGKNTTVLDVGTGAGFPGIPLKILYPNLQITLLDSLHKRVGFLNEVIDTLGLTGISAIHARAEEAARREDYREGFDLVVSRAVARLSSLSEYCIPFVKRGGYFVSYKAGEVEEECREAKSAVYLLGGCVREIRKTVIPGTDMDRSFVVIQKERGTPAKYPRKSGTPTKNPL